MNAKRILFLIFLCLIASLYSIASPGLVDSTEHKKITKLYETLKKTYAPDTRTAIFDLTTDDQNYILYTTEHHAVPQLRQAISNERIQKQVKIVTLPDESVGTTTKGIINLSVANLRVHPRNQAEMATQILLGTEVDLLTKANGYYRVRTPEGYIAWAPASALTPKTPEQAKQWRQAKKVIFTDDVGYSYITISNKSLRISDLVMGNILLAGKSKKGYIKISYPDGRSGYVAKHQVQDFDQWVASRKLTSENIINTAKSMMGLPYLWGGTSVKGVDCSGFTKTSYYMNGLIIPRDASQQVLTGDHIDIMTDGDADTHKILQNLKPADLLFFAANKEKDPNARITHVALYLGNGEFIHASGSVQINSLLRDDSNFDSNLLKTLTSARRYIDHQSSHQLQPISKHASYQTN